MDNLLKYAALLGGGALIYHFYLQHEAEKVAANPDEDMERELENKIRELEYREKVIARL